MIDIGITLTYIICSSWVKNLLMSTLMFNISQFFLSLNHHLLTLILGKVDFDSYVIKFFSNYLVDRKMNYFWNSFTLPSFNVNIEVDQDSALSYLIGSLSFTISLYSRKLFKKSKNSDFYSLFCK